MQVFGLTTWFACPEWGRAYWNPKKSLTDMAKEEAAPAAPVPVVEKVKELKKEADALVAEKKAIDAAKPEASKQEKLLELAQKVKDKRQ